MYYDIKVLLEKLKKAQDDAINVSKPHQKVSNMKDWAQGKACAQKDIRTMIQLIFDSEYSSVSEMKQILIARTRKLR